jgi:Fe-S-cluster containining protein
MMDATGRVLRQDARLLQIVDAAFADSALRSGEHLLCRAGCTQCCHGAFAINPLDALRLRTGMEALSAAQPELAAAVEQRAIAYLKEYGPAYPGNPLTGVLGDSEENQAAFEDFANDAACPALNPKSGLCDVYDARPMTCRIFGPPVRAASEMEDAFEVGDAFAVCELCFTEATTEEIAFAEMRLSHVEEAHMLEALADAHASPASAMDSTTDQYFTGDTIVAFCLISAPSSGHHATAS